MQLKLGERQELFSRLIAQLILHIYQEGFAVRCGDFQAYPMDRRHKENSLHYMRCAADLSLFKGGEFLTRTEDHRAFGMYWESLHPNCRWGGRYGDGNHYEFLEGPRVKPGEGN
jgi:hypothetical protein